MEPCEIFKDYMKEQEAGCKRGLLTNSGTLSQKELDAELKSIGSSPFAQPEHQSMSHSAEYEQKKTGL